MRFELVTQPPSQSHAERQQTSAAAAAPLPSAEAAAAVGRRAVKQSSDVQLVLERRQRSSSSKTALTASNQAASATAKPSRAAEGHQPVRAEKENRAEAGEAAEAAAAASRHRSSVRPASIKQPAIVTHTVSRPSKPTLISSGSLPASRQSVLSLRQQLASLPLSLLQAEILRVQSFSLLPSSGCLSPTPSTLYFNSPALSSLLCWLQAVSCAQSSQHALPFTPLVDNFTSALCDGVALLLLLSYYDSSVAAVDSVRWWRGSRRLQEGGMGATQLQADAAAADEEEKEATTAGWVGAFSFADITRRTETEEETVARHNWSVLALALSAAAPSLPGTVGFSLFFPQDAPRSVDERVVIAWLCGLCRLLLARSEETHAARRLQRWWRRCRVRKTTLSRLHDLLIADRVQAAQTVADTDSGDEEELEDQEEEDEEQSAERAAALRSEWENVAFSLSHARQRAEREQAMQTAALTLQRVWRGRQARLQLARRKEEREREREIVKERERESKNVRERERVLAAAALTVQKVWRGRRVRRDVRLLLSIKREVEQEMRREEQSSAAILIQAAVRGWRARRAVTAMRTAERLRKEKQEAERQAESERRDRARRETARRRHAAAAIIIQTHVRARLGRLRLQQLRAEWEAQLAAEREAAAEEERRQQEEQLLQRRIQARLQEEKQRREQEKQRRREAELHHRRERSARIIQRAWREWRRTKAVVAELREEIQAARLESAVISMQAIVRGGRARREAARLRAEKESKRREEEERALAKAATEQRRLEKERALLHRVRSINAVVIQRQLRVFLAGRLLRAGLEARQRQRDRSAAIIQAAWRGRMARLQTPQLQSLRRRLSELAAGRTEEQTLQMRTTAAVSCLLSSASIASISRSVQTLSVTCSLPCICEQVAASGALVALFSLIRSCNRSEPHTALLLHCLGALLLLASPSSPASRQAVFGHQQCATILTEQLQVYRDNLRVMRRVTRLLLSGAKEAGWIARVRETEAAVEGRVEGVCVLLEGRCVSERRTGRGWWTLVAATPDSKGKEQRDRERAKRVQEMEEIIRALRRFLRELSG